MLNESATLPIQLRLSAGAHRLDLFLPAEALTVPTDVLLAHILEQCREIGVQAPLSVAQLGARLRECCYGSWIPILERVEPVPPVDEQVELLVPVAISGQQAQANVQTVRGRTLIARIRPGRSGKPGLDLRTGPLPVRPPRRTRLPQGENTYVNAEGTQLFASCDGAVVLRQMALHVIPSYVHDGDLLVSHGVLRSSTPVTIRGSVRAGAVIEAGGDVQIAGVVEEASVASLRGSIVVAGSVSGTAKQPSQLRAHGDVRCRSVLHAQVAAGADIHLTATGYRSILQAGGNIYLQQSLEDSLREVSLSVGGGILPRLIPPPELVPMAPEAERQHVRASTWLPAQVALHGVPPLTFRPYMLEDLSAGGARCRLTVQTPDLVPAVGAIIQLKFALPGSGELVLGIGRVVRLAGPLTIGVAFLQMREHDQERLLGFCQHAVQRSTERRGTRANRRTRE